MLSLYSHHEDYVSDSRYIIYISGGGVPISKPRAPLKKIFTIIRYYGIEYTIIRPNNWYVADFNMIGKFYNTYS